MSSANPFCPQGNTVLITAAVSPPTGVQIPTFSATGVQSMQYRIKNSATADVAIGWGTSAALAATNAVIPGAASQSFILGAGQTEVFTLTPAIFLSAAIGTGTGAVYVTPGDGQ